MTNQDPVESDPAALSSAEQLDEDELRLDPLEQGIEPPERWGEADAYGTVPAEQQEGESIQQRVAEERADFTTGSPPTGSYAAAEDPPLDSLDDAVDNTRNQSESLIAEQPPDPPSPDDLERQNADRAGGSVADELREPDPPE